MTNRLNGAGLFSQAIYGLMNNFQIIGSGEGLTLEKLKNPGEGVNKNLINSQFQAYLASNFGKLDANGDGVISAEELQNYANNMLNKGMTQQELIQLCGQYGYSNSLLETVMANFHLIDKNHDGRVTNEEIAAFGMKKEIDEMKKRNPRFNPSAMSIFYSTGGTDEV